MDFNMDRYHFLRETVQTRKSSAIKACDAQVSDHFRAIFGCLLNEDSASPRLVEMLITPDGKLVGRCDGDSAFSTFLGSSNDLIHNSPGVTLIAELDGDELGFLVSRVAEIKRQR